MYLILYLFIVRLALIGAIYYNWAGNDGSNYKKFEHKKTTLQT